MRIVYFGNGPVALETLRYLRSVGEEIVALVLHGDSTRRLGREMITESGLPVDAVFEAEELSNKSVIGALAKLKADIGVSVLFAHILEPDLLQLFPRGVLNVHPSFLPFNRGRNAQIWGIIDGTPVGATLHYMDEGIDTGPIVERVEVAISPTDTGQLLRAKLEAASVAVLKKGWPAVIANKPPLPQDSSKATTHRVRDVISISAIDTEAVYRAGDLIDLLRALTSPPQASGAFYEIDGRKVRITVNLTEED